jgi:periplasmic divalent cation tolerance protein
VEATQLQENDKPVLVYATFPSGEVAETMGRQLVEQRLAACVNILPGMTSIYRWEGVIERDSEVVMIVKTRASLAEAAMGAV